MVAKTDTIWMNGELVGWDDAQVHVLAHGLHYGFGVFEGIRAYQRADGRSAIFRLGEHMQRFADSARMITLPLGYSVAELVDACVALCSSNRLRECYLRPLAFSGTGAMGVAALDNPTEVVIATWAWGAYLGDEALQHGVRVKTSTFQRPHVNSQLHKAKVTGHYINSILAKREALADGYHEALLLDTAGYVSEASGENLFVVVDGKLFTPPFGSAILGGITRATLIALAGEMGVDVVEQQLTRDLLYVADEVFMCGTAAEVTPVREVDRRVVGQGRPGPITMELQTRYFDVVKGRDDRPEWLTYYDATT